MRSCRFLGSQPRLLQTDCQRKEGPIWAPTRQGRGPEADWRQRDTGDTRQAHDSEWTISSQACQLLHAANLSTSHPSHRLHILHIASTTSQSRASPFSSTLSILLTLALSLNRVIERRRCRLHFFHTRLPAHLPPSAPRRLFGRGPASSGGHLIFCSLLPLSLCRVPTHHVAGPGAPPYLLRCLSP